MPLYSKFMQLIRKTTGMLNTEKILLQTVAENLKTKNVDLDDVPNTLIKKGSTTLEIEVDKNLQENIDNRNCAV